MKNFKTIAVFLALFVFLLPLAGAEQKDFQKERESCSAASAKQSTGTFSHEANRDKPHRARDFSVYIPKDFNRHSNASWLSIGPEDQLKGISASSKELIPGTYFNCTVGGLL
ncbi:MAG: hypothetical protein GY765_13450, partial [bacterium]|nr:hypothetical protein [bacterium]